MPPFNPVDRDEIKKTHGVLSTYPTHGTYITATRCMQTRCDRCARP